MSVISMFYKICNKFVRHTGWYRDRLFGGAMKFWSFRQFGTEVANLGSGAALHAFCYDGLSVKGANWALGPQSLVHDYSILKNFFSYMKEGGYIIITVCPFSGLFSKYDKTHNLKYYTFLHPATIIDFDDDERTKALKLKSNPFKELPFKCSVQVLKEGIVKAKGLLSKRRNVDLDHSAVSIMTGWKNQFGIQNLSAPISIQHKTEIESRRHTLEDIINFCKERNLYPVIVVPVMHHSLLAFFTEDFKIHYIDSLLSGLEAPVLNYMYDDMSNKDDSFTTALFLNKRGSLEFTSKVINDIEKIKMSSCAFPSMTVRHKTDETVTT